MGTAFVVRVMGVEGSPELGWMVPRAELQMSDVNGPAAVSTSAARWSCEPTAPGLWSSPLW